jgi:2-dehydropantoate 2-reductase
MYVPADASRPSEGKFALACNARSMPACRALRGQETSVRICVVGAGATGGHFAVKLAAAGHDVSVIARGAHLAAIRASGLTLIEGDAQQTARLAASSDPGDFPVQDFVLVTVKATGLAGIASNLAPLLGPETMVGFPQNGMSWWYPLGLPADRPAPPDLPIFRLAAAILPLVPVERIVGGSIYSANELVGPGVIRNTSPGRNILTLGLPTPGREATLAAVQAAFAECGIASPRVDDIRRTIWSKLLVNMSGSTIALATENMSSICRTDPALGEIYRRVLREGLAIAEAHGYPLGDSVDADRLLARLVDHKPSLLQDYEQRRPMEVAEIVEAPLAFARARNVATPTLDTLAAIVARRARDRGLL